MARTVQDAPSVLLETLIRERMQKARPVADVVVEMLRQAIQGGLLHSGQVLRQDELAAMFGVSRMPVREALRRLDSEGLVKHLPRHGFVVATHTAREIAEVYEIRTLLEGHAMRLAVPRLDEDLLGRLEEAQARMRTQTDPFHQVDARDTFYRTLYEAADRPRLLRLIMQLRAEVARYLLAKQTPHSHSSHAELMTICRRRDGRAAETFIREHLRRVAAMLLDLVQDERPPEEDRRRIRP